MRQHKIHLSNGSILLVSEAHDGLYIGSEYLGQDRYICHLCPDKVITALDCPESLRALVQELRVSPPAVSEQVFVSAGVEDAAGGGDAVYGICGTMTFRRLGEAIAEFNWDMLQPNPAEVIRIILSRSSETDVRARKWLFHSESADSEQCVVVLMETEESTGRLIRQQLSARGSCSSVQEAEMHIRESVEFERECGAKVYAWNSHSMEHPDHRGNRMTYRIMSLVARDDRD